MFLDAPGSPIPILELTVPKAAALAAYVASGKHPYAELVETRRNPDDGQEIVMLDVAVEVSQNRVYPILDRERLAVSFDREDQHLPEVVALRSDFPWVPHLNQRESEFPRSLCLYELPYSTIKLRWTPTGCVERIREWLALSAAGKLHQNDQPLEPVFLGAFPPLILPSNFLETIKNDPGLNDGQMRFGVNAVGANPNEITGFIVTNPKMTGVSLVPDHVATAVVAAPQKHGIVRITPKALRDVIDVMRNVDVDLLNLLRQRIQSWRNLDHNVVRARMLLILLFPKMREEGAPAENWEWDMWGFLLIANVGEIGTKLGIWEATAQGTIATLIPPGADRSADIAVQIVNPVLQLTKEAAARFNGTHADQRKCAMVGVGALGSLVLLNLIRKGFGVWSIFDDDLMMPHNGARHALPAAASGAPKVTGFRQLTDAYYEDPAVSAVSRTNVLRSNVDHETTDSMLAQADVIFDCSADVAAARYLALDVQSSSRRLSLFLAPTGEQMVILIEDVQRRIPLDALEMQFYRMLLATEQLQDHYATTNDKIRYGRSCRDLSAILSADAIACFAGIASRAVERLLSDESANIRVWKFDKDLSVTSFDAIPKRTFRTALPRFTVQWDEGVVEKLRWFRGEKLPNETGGALVGCWDLSRKILYVVDVTGAPTDSVEQRMAFIRGSKDLPNWIAGIRRNTGDAVEYVGEWHSHPNGFSTKPSPNDREQFRWVEKHLSFDGLPAVTLIIGSSDLRWISGAEGDGDVWSFPS